MFEGICEAIHKELDKMDEKYMKGTQLSGADLEDINKMAHTLKSLKTYEAMSGNSEYDGSYDSYARGRSRTTGRYVSRDGDRGNGMAYEGSYRRY